MLRGFLVLVGVVCSALSQLRTVDDFAGFPDSTNFESVWKRGELLERGWVEQSENWPKCIEYTKEFAKNESWEAIPYPSGDLSNLNNTAIVLLVGSADYYKNDFKRGLINLEKQFNDFYHFPIIAFHFNLNEEEQNGVRKTTRAPITFIQISGKPLPTDPSSPLNPTPVLEHNQFPYSNSLEYRFQTFFYFDLIFNHPAVKNYTYIMRIDNDIDILVPINFNPFALMETQGKVFSIRHWSLDPIEICRGIYGPVELYRREMYQWLGDARFRALPPQCYCGGGATYWAFAPFFRTPQFRLFWKFLSCLGGSWTNRWSEQNFFPMALTLLADNYEKRFHHFTNVPVNHRGGLLQPHAMWGVPNWPYHPQGDIDKTVTYETEPTHFNRGCVIYFLTPEEVTKAQRSLTNLEVHWFHFNQYPVFIFHTDLTKAHQKSILSVLDQSYTKVRFVQLPAGTTRSRFYLSGMFEQDLLEDFGYFIRMDADTQLLVDTQWDMFRLMEMQRFDYGYHRWHSPIVKLDPAPNPDLWIIAEKAAKKFGGDFAKRKLPPKDFYHSLEYFAAGSFSFFRSKDYQLLVKEFPDTASTSHVFPLAVALLEDEPWRKVLDLSNLNMNWGTSEPTPFATPSWYEQSHIPVWPWRYTNRNPTCPAS